MSNPRFRVHSRSPRRRPRPRPLLFEVMEPRQLLSAMTFVVNNTNDNGDNINPTPGSLRQAIIEANAHNDPLQDPSIAIPDQIVFAIPGSGPFVIQPASPLPQIKDPVDINGYSQYNFMAGKPTYARDQTIPGAPLIQLDGSLAGAGAVGLDVAEINCWIGGLIITRFSDAAISLDPDPDLLQNVEAGAIGDVVWSNDIGVNSFDLFGPNNVTPGANSLANGVGISISSSNNVIGGTIHSTGNIIQGNNVAGIMLSGPTGTGNLVKGNTILDNGDGVLITTSNNVIGGTDAISNNVISGNMRGVHIQGNAAKGNIVQNNEIGSDLFANISSSPATSQWANLGEGVLIEDAPGNLIGGTLPGTGNLIVDNGLDGVSIQDNTTTGATGNQVQGNKISYNRDGINISSANNVIGGALELAANTIVNNQRNGIAITSKVLGLHNEVIGDLPNAQPTGNLIANNLIGSDGFVDLGNTLNGVLIEAAAGNTIGGTALLARNVISGNNIGVTIRDAASTGNVVLGNSIGAMSSGQGIVPNALDGVRIDNAPGNVIGGTASGAGNVISGNNWGVRLTGSSAKGNLVQGNAIGTDVGGTLLLRNAIDGVVIDLGASNNTIGGTANGAGNTIAYNVGNGVNVLSGTGNAIESNKIYGNNLLGIDLGGDGVTTNPPPLPGPNDWQAFPTLSSVVVGTTSMVIQGTLQSTPGTSFLIQFFANPGASKTQYGPGQTLIGSATVTTDASGVAQIYTNLLTTVPLGTGISATATNLTTNDTSEFSQDAISGSTPAPLIVSNTNDSGTGSLRDALNWVISHPSPSPSAPDVIDFDITGPGTGPFTIFLTSPLPTISVPVDIEGYSQPGSQINKTLAGTDEKETDVAVLMVQVDGSAIDPARYPGANGLTITNVGVTVSGLSITGFKGGAGIALNVNPGAPDNQNAISDDIWGNFIGVSSFDTQSSSLVNPMGNPLANGVGIAINSSNNRIGGTLPPSRNVIQGNIGVGVSLTGQSGTGNLIEGNYILDNGADGLLIATSNNYIGEAIGLGPAGGGNIISGNTNNGIHIVGNLAQGNVIVNNEIGTDVGRAGLIVPIRGMNPRPNLLDGILIEDSPGNIIGGLLSNSYNVIAANGIDGIGIQNKMTTGATGNQMIGNWIGFNKRSDIISILPNRDGINISSADNIIGGTSTAARNVIINNQRNGITISGQNLDSGNRELGGIPNADPTGNVVEGNYIGTQGGADHFGNALEGILIDDATDNLIGGTAAGAGNVISANNDGVVIRNPMSTGNAVAGNLIGTMADGVTVLGNAVDGVKIDNAPSNTIGGTASGAGNVISGNNWGVRLTGSGATSNTVAGNFIGTDHTGTVPVRNSVDGVLITGGASNNTIGGTANGAGNAIAYNVGNGVNVVSGTQDSILSNRIYGNNLLGIDLGGDGVTPNHPGGGNGPNDLQSFPVLTVVSASGTSTSIQGTLNSLPNTSFLIQFFSNTSTTRSGYGPGESPIGSLAVTTDGNGFAPIVATVTGVVPQGAFISATATSLNPSLSPADTSEFSLSVPSTPVLVQFAAASYTVDQKAGSITIDVKRSGNTKGLVTVAYATGGGNAQPGTNYNATSGTLTFNPGDTVHTITIPIIDTHTVGPNTTVNLTLSNPTGGATLGTPNPVTVTIKDNDLLTTEFATAGFAVSEDAGNATITVTRNSGGTSSTVNYALAGGSARPGVNYTPTSGTLTFGPGQTSRTITVPILHDGLVTGPLSVGIALSSPSSGILGSQSNAVLTINDIDRPGALELAASTMTVSSASGFANVVVRRVGGVGGTVAVTYATGGGSAVPGMDYSQAAGVLTFNPGEASKIIAVPILNHNAAGKTVFGLTLGNATGGATLGSPASLVITISPEGTPSRPNVTSPSAPAPAPNAIGPVVTDLRLLNNGQAITGIVLSFDRPLDPSRAEDVANYGGVIRTPGGDGVLGTYDDGLVAIASASYDPSANRVTLTPSSPLPLNVFYQVAINQNANALTGAGLADPSGALLNAGGSGGPYEARFGLGTQLSYTDPQGNATSLTLSGGGLMELRLGADGQAQQLRILGPSPGRSTLKGQVHGVGPNASGRASLPLILGAGGVKVRLKSFAIGGISTAPATPGLPSPSPLPPKRHPVRMIKHVLHRHLRPR